MTLMAQSKLLCGYGLVVESVSHPYMKARVLAFTEGSDAAHIILDTRMATFTQHPEEMLLPAEAKQLKEMGVKYAR